MGPPSDEHECKWQEYALYLKSRQEKLQKDYEESLKNNAELIQSNEMLKQELRSHKRHRFGRRSEKSSGSRSEKAELTEEQKAERRRKAKEKRRKNRASRANLPLQRTKLEVPQEQRICERCGEFAEFEELEGGNKETEIIEQTIGSLTRLLYERQKLRCRCGKTFVEAKPPVRVFPECEFGPALIALIIVRKTLDSLPFYRQRKALFREGLYVNDNTLGQLFHKAADKLLPLYELLKSEVKESWLILADETVLKYLRPPLDLESGSDKKTNRGYAWCFLDPENKRVVFIYDRSRASDIPEDLLKDTKGIVVCDGYSGYNVLVNSYDRERAGCLAHARRKFFDLLESDGDLVSPILDQFKVVYRVERQASESEGVMGSVEHLAQRQACSLPALKEIKALCENALQQNLEPTHPVAKAMSYFLNQWPNLIKFTENARIPVDNNFCERVLRIVALLRKNSLFVGNAESGQRTMVLLSLAQSCVLVGVNPLAYFADVLLRIDEPGIDLSELLPENWRPPP